MKSRCKITFEGLNVNRFVNSLASRGITMYEVKRQGRMCAVEVPSKQYQQVVALLKEKCYNIVRIEYKGSFAVWRFCKARFVLLAFVMACVLAVAVMSGYCQKIVISGDFSEETVIERLNELGVKRGKNISRLDVVELENALANKLDAMYAVINKKGSVLYVNAVERKTTQPPIDVHTRRDIISAAEGIVTSVLCEQGTARVKVGDYVRVGDVLIAGERTFNDGTAEDAYALGRITVEIKAVGFAEYVGVKTVTERTGKSVSYQNAVLFGSVYGKSCPFVNFEKTESSVYLFPFNLEIRRITYYETRTVTVAASLDECLDELKDQALKNAQSNCGFEVLKTEINVKNNGVEAILFGEKEMR